MPHAAYTRDLGRNRSWRKATVQSLAQALIRRERIRTTLSRAKEAQRLTERLITLGKAGTLAARRNAIRLVNDAETVRRLFAVVAPRFQKRSGGYTRILHNGTRAGDGASLAVVELVELGDQPKPPVSDKPKVEKPRVEHPRTQAQEKPKEKKPRGFMDNLRKFFKRRDNP